MLYKQIQCFLEVANYLSFTAAAQHLYMSQQAVTKQIAALERELGIKLFYRTTRQVTLTPAGTVLRDDFAQINRQIDDSIHRAREMEQSGKNLLRIGFQSALSRRDIILPVTDFLMNRYQDLEVDVQLMDFVALRNGLMNRKLDMCVTTSNDWQLWPGTQATVLQRKQFQVIYSQRHPLAKQETITLEDMAQYTHLLLPDDTTLERIDSWSRRIPFRRCILCPDIESLMIRLELGQGFALLTRVIEGCDAPVFRYWDVPFPEAHAEIVCLCGENAPEEVKRAIYEIRENNVVKI
ncbi:MAG: LysR family transcriptional regulator [Oscillospiraceae bacterium]|nr:LysR family transcriptional regulator [Oscillospiraceae bacterium]